MSRPATFTYQACLTFYRRLIGLYPPAFRRRFEAELLLAFRDLYRRAEREGSLRARLGCLFWLLADLLTSIPQENYFAWREQMKNGQSILKTVGILILAAWFSMWALSLGKSLLGLPLPDPFRLILGEQFSALALNAMNFFVLFAPLVVLLIFLRPSLRVQRGGEEAMQIRVLRMSRLTGLVVAFCAGVTVLFWAVIFLARMGLL